jgi:hypothetical protein
MDKEEFYTSIIQHQPEIRSLIFAEDNLTFWAFNLFVLIYLLRYKGIPIIAYLNKLSNLTAYGQYKLDEEYRRELLKRLGVTIVERDSIPLNGVALNALTEDPTSTLFIRLTKENAGERTTFVRYDGNSDSLAVNYFLQTVMEGTIPTLAAFKPSISATGNLNELEKYIRNVPQYSSENIEVEICPVKISDLFSPTYTVREHKFLQVEMLVQHLQENNYELFQPLDVLLDGGSITSIMTPPVLEMLGTDLVIIEGLARLFYCKLNGIEEVNCVVVKPKPGKSFMELPRPKLELKRIRMVGVGLEDDLSPDARGRVRRVENEIHKAQYFLDKIKPKT